MACTIEEAILQVEKKYGKEAIMKFGAGKKVDTEVIPTGALSLDIALGTGGIPRGRMVELFGPESSGKTTAALHITAEAQKMKGKVMYIDVENALDPKYAEEVGVNMNDVLISQPDTGENALDIVDIMAKSSSVHLIVVDSVAALVPRAEIEGEMGDSHVGLQARMMSQAMRKLSGALSKSKTTCIFINQIREKVGVMFGSPETTPGGRALKYFSSVRLDIRRTETLKDTTGAFGNKTKVKVVKNKLAPPFREAFFDIIYGKGISRTGCIIDLATENNIIKKSGAWYSYADEKIGQGREAAKNYLENNPEKHSEIEEKIRRYLAI